MATVSASLSPASRMEDVLAHLPIAGVTEYSRGETIYAPACPSNSLYLIISGKVLISQNTLDRGEVVLDIIRPDELFGETAFLDEHRLPEQAVALEAVTVMTWGIHCLEDMVIKRPRLALALLQVVTQRNAELRRRVESLSCDAIDHRLARVLLRFSQRLGEPQNDGTVRLMPMTHELLARCVGTSREIVTQYMNRFRRLGYLSYSRLGMVFIGDGLRAMLEPSCDSVGSNLVANNVPSMIR